MTRVNTIICYYVEQKTKLTAFPQMYSSLILVYLDLRVWLECKQY